MGGDRTNKTSRGRSFIICLEGIDEKRREEKGREGKRRGVRPV